MLLINGQKGEMAINSLNKCYHCQNKHITLGYYTIQDPDERFGMGYFDPGKDVLNLKCNG